MLNKKKSSTFPNYFKQKGDDAMTNSKFIIAFKSTLSKFKAFLKSFKLDKITIQLGLVKIEFNKLYKNNLFIITLFN